VITPINIALLGVLVLAAVALVVSRRRRSGATHEDAAGEAGDETVALTEDDAVVDDDHEHDDAVTDEPEWAEAAATLAPVREDEAESAVEADEEDESLEADAGEDDEADADEHDADEGTEDIEDEARDGQDQSTGEIEMPEGLDEPEAGAGILDDGLDEIITEPGWYLPGETDMTWEVPGAETSLLVPEAGAGGLEEPQAEQDEAGGAAAHLGQGAEGFDTTMGWAAPADVAAEGDPNPAGPSWLGLAGPDDPAADAAPDADIAFEATPASSGDLFGLPELPGDEQGRPHHELELDPPPFPLDRWEDPAAPAPAPAPAAWAAQGETTVARHGPLTVSIDPSALLAAETEAVQRSTSRDAGDVSWELILKVELRQRGDAPASEAD
jgi:hypothetical protein